MKRRGRMLWRVVAVLLVSCVAGAGQTAYQPKFPGDPARSDSEAAALGYMRTVLRAQKLYHKKNDKYALSLADLVHTGSFTRRMVNSDRGDYTVGFRPSKGKGRGKDKDKEGFELTLTPKQLDAEHRSFYASEDGLIHADDQGPASENSPVVK
jgi:hypothetical protein